jgi:DNA-binding MarR family transcriptional regulator
MNQKETILQLIFDLSHAIKQYMRKSHDDDDIGITMSQRMVIGMLFRHKELKISELSQKLGLSNSTTSGIVDRLEKQRFVERVRGEKDRRVVRVRLTSQFQDKHQDMQKSMEDNLEKLISTCTQDELGKVVDGLSILKDVLERS